MCLDSPPEPDCTVGRDRADGSNSSSAAHASSAFSGRLMSRSMTWTYPPGVFDHFPGRRPMLKPARYEFRSCSTVFVSVAAHFSSTGALLRSRSQCSDTPASNKGWTDASTPSSVYELPMMRQRLRMYFVKISGVRRPFLVSKVAESAISLVANFGESRFSVRWR